MEITLKTNNKMLYRGAISDITPLGFTVEVPLAETDLFRDDSGRFIQFDIELKETQGKGIPQVVVGQGVVKAVRRVSQQCCGMSVRFINLDQGSYRVIAQWITPQADTPFHQQMVG